jgi:hypothetical protein
MLYIAAGEDYLKIKDVIQQPAAEFLMFLNFYKRKCELDNIRIKSSYNK